jgi:hypothetical protein
MAVIFFLAFIGIVALASAFGWVADSREFADWRAVRDGEVQPLPRP